MAGARLMPEVREGMIDGVHLLQPVTHDDERGFFREMQREERLAELGLPRMVQVNHSRSTRGVTRGLHMQLDPPQAKLITCTRGAIFDVVVDLRADSPSFLHWQGFELTGDGGAQVYCPVGFAHGFQVLSDTADVVYFCSNYFNPAGEQAIALDDPKVAVDWPLAERTISRRDQAAPRLADDWPGVSI